MTSPDRHMRCCWCRRLLDGTDDAIGLCAEHRAEAEGLFGSELVREDHEAPWGEPCEEG
jgi:hypothetical protein